MNRDGGARERHEALMRRALSVAGQNPHRPYGAVIGDVRTGEVVVEGHNHTERNPLGHAELVILMRLIAERPGEDYSNLVLFSTAEPCPMCQSAIEFSGIGGVCYGVSIPWLIANGWKQLDIRADAVHARAGWSASKPSGQVLEDECKGLFLQARRR